MSAVIDSLLFYDRDAGVRIIDRRLPHWSQAGVATFITWRTCDSMPKDVIDRWREDRNAWLMARGRSLGDRQWCENAIRLPANARSELLDIDWNRWNDALDSCSGACELKRPELAKIVADSLHHFDGDRYRLFDYVIMPNHVHLLVAFPSNEIMLAQCEGWKRFTSTRLNRKLGCQGRFWQADSFDHLVRSEEQFQYLRRYIAENPLKAGLRAGEYIWYSSDASICPLTEDRHSGRVSQGLDPAA